MNYLNYLKKIQKIILKYLHLKFGIRFIFEDKSKFNYSGNEK